MTHTSMIRRAALPEILLSEDVAQALGMSVSGARKAIRRGDCGRFARIGRRLVIIREDFLDALRRQADLRLFQPEGVPPCS